MTNWLHVLAIKPPLKDDKTFYCENYVDIDALLPYVCDNIGDIYPEGGWGPTDSNTVNFGLYVTMETGTTTRAATIVRVLRGRRTLACWCIVLGISTVILSLEQYCRDSVFQCILMTLNVSWVVHSLTHAYIA